MPSACRFPELGPRGEGWFVLQLLLGAAIAGSGFVGVYWPASADSFLGILGLLIGLAGPPEGPAGRQVSPKRVPENE